MAKKNLWLGMLVMVLVFGMTVVGCDNGIATSANDPFAGTWISNVVGVDVRIVASDGNWRQYINNVEGIRGTYSFSGNNVTLRLVDIRPAVVFSGVDEWVSWVNLDPAIQEHFGGSQTTAGTISGNTFSAQGVTHTRQ